MENKKISICIPYYNRADMVMETLVYPLTDDRIDEIIICDDCSPASDFENLLSNIKGLPKIKVVRNVVNHHVQHSKRNAISFAKNDWLIILDNDNVIDKGFVDRLYSIVDWYPDTIYHPAFASPTFDYRQFNGKTFSKQNVATVAGIPIFVTLLNTNNYFVNKKEYLKIYQYDSACRGADGIYNNYNWMKAGNKIHIVSDLTYFHRVHAGSEFLNESESNMKLIYNWLEKVKKLK